MVGEHVKPRERARRHTQTNTQPPRAFVRTVSASKATAERQENCQRNASHVHPAARRAKAATPRTCGNAVDSPRWVLGKTSVAANSILRGMRHRCRDTQVSPGPCPRCRNTCSTCLGEQGGARRVR